nr:hypothetical protein CFP56_61668 [Quercus suber]
MEFESVVFGINGLALSHCLSLLPVDSMGNLFSWPKWLSGKPQSYQLIRFVVALIDLPESIIFDRGLMESITTGASVLIPILELMIYCIPVFSIGILLKEIQELYISICTIEIEIQKMYTHIQGCLVFSLSITIMFNGKRD